MSVSRISCPECGAGLKSATGFKPGQSVTCPKCESYFAVEDPEEDEPGSPISAREVEDEEEEDRPRKRKKRRRDEDDDARSYRNSPIRYAILSILIVVMLVLAYFLYEKRKREAEAADVSADSSKLALLSGSHKIGRHS